MAEQANIVWAVEIDASTGIQALVESLAVAQSHLDAIDLRARQLGDTISEVVTPRRAISIDDTAVKALAGSIGGMQEQFVALESQARTIGAKVADSLTITPTVTLAMDDSAIREAATGIQLVGMQSPSSPPEPARANAAAPAAEAPRPAGLQSSPSPAGLAPRTTQVQPAPVQLPDVTSPTSPSGQPSRPATVQPGLASAPIKLAREELLAAENSAAGLGAAIRLANASLDAMKAPDSFKESFRQSLQMVQRDFLAGRATAEEAMQAVTDTQRDAATAFVQAEREKTKAAAETKKTLDEQKAVIAQGGQIAGTMTAAFGSAAATMLSLEERTRAAYGETQLQLYALHQMQEAIPGVVASLSGLSQLATSVATGSALGIAAGAGGLVTGLVGVFSALFKPVPRPEARKEGIEDSFARIQTGALKSDTAQATRERMARSLETIERHTARRDTASPTVRA